MRFSNEFTVAAAPDKVWTALLDVPNVATCLPGAAAAPGEHDGEFIGTMTVKVGPVTTKYDGTMRLTVVSDVERIAQIDVVAGEVKGQGGARATIRNHVLPEGDGSRVVADTELEVSGRQAQFGRSLMEDVANVTLERFSAELERRLTTDGDAADGATARPIPVAALGVTDIVKASPRLRFAAAGGAGLITIAFLWYARPRRD